MICKVFLIILSIIFMLLLSSYIFFKFRQKKITYLLIQTIKALNTTKIKYWVDFGTLLGIIRENGVIFLDMDGDICVLDSKDLEKQMLLVEKYLKSEGLILRKVYNSIYRVFFRKNDFKNDLEPFIDIYINKYDSENHIIRGATGKKTNIHTKLIGDTRFIDWNGLKTRVPQNIHDTLVWRYGENYMTPKPFFKGRDSKKELW